MAENLLIGIVVIALCFTIQCSFVSILLRILKAFDGGRSQETTSSGISMRLVVSMLIMVIGNLLQMAIWAIIFMLLGEFSDYHKAFYHSAENFTTLGYGDIVMSESRRLLGTLEAANGVMMFGLTTSVLFTILVRLSKLTMGKGENDTFLEEIEDDDDEL